LLQDFGTASPKIGSSAYSAFSSSPLWMASMMARVCLMLHALADPVGAAGPAGVEQPHVHLLCLHLLGQQLGVLGGVPHQEGRAEAGEKVAWGSVTPTSVPATLAV
jgi:hypothetical protein